MSVRTRYSIVKGVSEERAKRAIAEAAELFPGNPPRHSKWSDWTYVVTPKTFEAFVSDNLLVIADDAWLVAKEIARIIDAPHLELRVQESDHWDFSLYDQGSLIADFSTRVTYFDEDPNAPRPWKMGSVWAFSKAWDVPEERLAPYLMDWDTVGSSDYAHKGDKYQTGDWRQVFDFMRALGIDEPASSSKSFAFSVPSWGRARIGQPIWRRAIRKVSVWIKGTYPDVPKRTKAEEEEWRRRRASVQVVRVSLDDIIQRDRTDG